VKDLLDDNRIQYLIRERNIIPPYELDFYIDEFKLAIETNGFYWHSDLFVNKNYHYEKFLRCNNKGIKLLQFFEDDVIFRTDIVRSIISHNLNIHEKVIHGRNCKISEIESKEKGEFLRSNHLMGNDKAMINLGAFHNDELVAVMTFNKGNITITNSDKFDWELSRFCCKNFYKVHGIADKLFKYFVRDKNRIKIITYASLMTGTGNVYKNLGFKFLHTTKPGYFYFKGKQRFHRFVAVNNRIDRNISEREDMLNQGLLRVYDAGNNKFYFERKDEE